jgi:hypothetical protein
VGTVVGTVVGAVGVPVVGGGVGFEGLVATVFSVRPTVAATVRVDPHAANVNSGKSTPAIANA